MDKLYQRIDFHNGKAPAINETNLNAISKAVDDIDDRVVAIADDVLESVPEILKLVKDVEPNARIAQKSAEDAQRYAQEASEGVGANGLEYTEEDSILKLMRDEYVLDEVEIKSGSGNTVSWTGTKAKWKAFDKSNLEDGAQVNITDDYDVDASVAERIEHDINSNVLGSDAYDNSKSYVSGNTCIDDNTLWKCKIPCSGVRPSTDNGTYWEKATLDSLVGEGQYELLLSKTMGGGWASTDLLKSIANYRYLVIGIAINGASLIGAITIPTPLFRKFASGSNYVHCTASENGNASYYAMAYYISDTRIGYRGSTNTFNTIVIYGFN